MGFRADPVRRSLYLSGKAFITALYFFNLELILYDRTLSLGPRNGCPPVCLGCLRPIAKEEDEEGTKEEDSLDIVHDKGEMEEEEEEGMILAPDLEEEEKEAAVKAAGGKKASYQSCKVMIGL